MIKRKFNLLSSNFSHTKGSTWYKVPRKLEWDFFSKTNSVSVYIDSDIHNAFIDKNDGKLKFLWCLESPFFNGSVFDVIERNLEQVLDTFEQIWTYNINHLSLSPKFKWVPAYGVSVDIKDKYNKNKKISMITSSKSQTPQQRERIEFLNKNSNKIDVYGRGFKEIISKNMGLDEYMFSVAIENTTMDDYFTEKILDCFATKTIPLYKGTSNISNYFDSNSIIFLGNGTDLTEFDYNFYEKNIESINSNFEKVLEFEILDDWIFNKYLKDY